jgi:16S rRNA (guanine527-N7)-methyltransferase
VERKPIRPARPMNTKTEKQAFTEFLRQGALALALKLTDEGLTRLVAHWELLQHWADRMNLTTVRDPASMAERLYLDSAMLLTRLADDSSVHDVGSGAGFPGLVLKALRPSIQVVISEARRKKVNFLRQAARTMNLHEGLEIRHNRVGWEQPAEAGYDEVVSRAVFPPQEWLKIGASLVSPTGRLWVFSGQPHGETEASQVGNTKWLTKHLPAGLRLDEMIPYELPFCKKQRILVSLRKAPAQ